ncbi:nucleolar protein 9-like [Glandiceps talaboti]
MAAPRRGKGPRDKMRLDEDTDRIIPGRLDEETMGYYKRVSETLAEEFDTEEDKELFIQNVFAQTEKEEVKLSQNQTVSRILENLIRNGKQKQVQKFLRGLSSNFKKVCFDRFAAYVLQTIVARIPILSDEENSEEQVEDLPSFDDLLLQLCDILKDNISEVLCDVYASHVLRAVFEVLGGVQVSESVVRSRLSRQQQNKENPKQTKPPQVKRTPSKKFTKMLKKLTKLVLKREDIKDLMINPVSNPVLQSILLVLQQVNSDLCTDLCQVIMSQCEESNSSETSEEEKQKLPTIFTHEVGSHLAEVLLKVGNDDITNQLYSEKIAGKVVQLAVHPIANYVLQKYISSISTKERFEQVFEECEPGFEDILAMNHIGVIIRLAESCVRFNTKQGLLLKALMESFHCHKPKSRQLCCVQLFASFTTYEVFYQIQTEHSEDKDTDGKTTKKKNKEEDSTSKEETKNVELQDVNLQGSLLLQQLLKFNNCQKIVNSFLNLTEGELFTLACNQSGSHIVEAFFKSNSVGEKNKDEILEKFRGWYLKMSCTKNGSRTVDSIWSVTTLKNKYMIAEELVKKESQLSQDRFGRFVFRNCAIGHFKNRQKDWKDIQTREEKKRKMFSDLIGDGEMTSSKKQKKETDTKQKQDMKYQKEMAALGFDSVTAEKTTENTVIDDDDNDEIDNLFKKRKGDKVKSGKKKAKRLQSKHSESTVEISKAIESSEAVEKMVGKDHISPTKGINTTTKKTKKKKKTRTP